MIKRFFAFDIIVILLTLVGVSRVNAVTLLREDMLIRMGGGDCVAIGQRVADSQGGTLTRATPIMQNGREVCVVIVLVSGENGERPRRVEVAVPTH